MKMKKTIALLLALLMIAAFPLGANAASVPIFKTGTVETGTFTDTISYSIDTETGVLTFSGEGAMPDYTSANNLTWRFRTYITEIVIGEGITHIGSYVFSRMASVKKCSMPSTLESIGEYAFENNTGLEEIILPSKVTKVGSHAFLKCTGVKYLKTNSVISDFDETAFWDMHGVETLDAYSIEVFEDFRVSFINVADITLRNGTVNSATLNCGNELKNLKTLTFGNGVKNLNEMNFSVFETIEAINVVDDNPDYASKDGVLYTHDMKTLLAYPLCKQSPVCEIDSNTTAIASKAFTMTKYLKKVILPKGFSSDAMTAMPFALALSLEAIEADKDSDTLSSVDGVLYSKSGDTLLVYPANKEGNTFNIPNGVETIQSAAFVYAPNLENLTFPSTLKKISQMAVYQAGNIKSFEIPESVEEIDGYAFYGSFESVYVYGKNVNINADAFCSTEDYTIYGYEGSTAQTYATDNSVNFVALSGGPVLNVLANNGVSDTSIKYDEPKAINVSDITISPVDKKILTGLYTDSDRKTAAESTFTLNAGENTLYSDWTDIGTLAAEAEDRTGSTALTSGFDLFGAQFREKSDSLTAGLRFCTRVSKSLISEIESKTGNPVECGYVLCKKDSVPENAQLEVGMTTTSGKTVKENAAPIKYYDGKGYFVYTAVIVDIPDNMQGTDIVARPYIKYTDANGVARYYYFTENGSSNCGGGYYTNYEAVQNASKTAQ